MTNSQAEQSLKTKLGKDIPLSTRGILYICKFQNMKLEVIHEILFDDLFEALNSYANIPNPESQLIKGKTYNELIVNMLDLHEKIQDKKWLTDLSNCL